VRDIVDCNKVVYIMRFTPIGDMVDKMKVRCDNCNQPGVSPKEYAVE
jgi:hypothetical protein